MICPKCKAEYREGFTVCADCGVALVEAPKEAPEEADKTELVFDRPTFLCSVNDNMDGAVLIEALKEHHIPVMLQTPKTGIHLTVYMGMNYLGSDIYVPAVMWEEAQNIADSFLPVGELPDQPPGEPEDREFEAEGHRAVRNRRIKGWILFAFSFGIPALVVLVVLLLRLFL